MQLKNLKTVINVFYAILSKNCLELSNLFGIGPIRL